MCEVLDRIENKGRREGRLEGRREGRLEGHREGQLEGERKGKMETALNLRHMGMDDAFIAKAVNVSIETVRQWLAEAST